MMAVLRHVSGRPERVSTRGAVRFAEWAADAAAI
jgi:hypothetical protein